MTRLLKAELNAIGQTVSEDFYCVDSIDIFRSADCMISVARNRISPQPLDLNPKNIPVEFEAEYRAPEKTLVKSQNVPIKRKSSEVQPGDETCTKVEKTEAAVDNVKRRCIVMFEDAGKQGPGDIQPKPINPGSENPEIETVDKTNERVNTASMNESLCDKVIGQSFSGSSNSSSSTSSSSDTDKAAPSLDSTLPILPDGASSASLIINIVRNATETPLLTPCTSPLKYWYTSGLVPTINQSYKLVDVYRRLYGHAPPESHRAEDDCITLLKCALRTRDFVILVDKHAKLFSTIKPGY